MDFYQFFSFSAKKAIYRANDTCTQFGNQYLEPEHILYAILNLRSCSAVQVLHQLGVNLPKLTHSLAEHLNENSGNFKGQASFSKRTLVMLDISMKEVKRLHHREIGTTHLLISLAQERQDCLSDLFAEHGLDADAIRQVFLKHLKGLSYERAATERRYLPEQSAWEMLPHAQEAGYFKSLSRAAAYAVHHAQFLAKQLNHHEVTPEHVALFMLLDAQSAATCNLRDLGADRPRLIRELTEYVMALAADDPTDLPKLNAELEQVLVAGLTMMVQLGGAEVETWHLLAAMASLPGTQIGMLLKAQNLSESIMAQLKYSYRRAAKPHPQINPPEDEDEAKSDPEGALN